MGNTIGFLALCFLTGVGGGWAYRGGLAAPEASAAAPLIPEPLLRDAPADDGLSESERAYFRGVDAYIARDLAKAKASFERALALDAANARASNALRRVTSPNPY